MRQAFGEYDDRSDEFALVGEEREEGYAPPHDRRLSKIVLTMLVMAVFAGGLWFAYHLGARHVAPGDDGVPLIRADRTPDKVRPAQPGGMKIPDQNVSIYNEKPGAAPVENLLPPPEKPLPRPEPPPPPPLPPRQQAAVPAPSPPAPPSPAPMPATAPAASPQPAGFGKIQVRLASVRTPEAARAEWTRLKRDNPDLLGRLSAFAVRDDLGDKGIYYAVEAGPFDNAAAAERLCGALKRRNFGCVVAR